MSEGMSNRRSEEGNGFFCRFTFGQFFALLVLEVFTLFFVFYLGARYGREFLGMGGQPAVVAEGETDRGAPKVVTTSDPEVAKMAGELIAKADTPALKERIRKMIDEAQGQKTVRAPEVSDAPPVRDETTSSGDIEERPPEHGEVAESEDKAAAEAARDTSVIRVKSAENARYSVQVGSYPQMNEAAEVVERWKAKGYPAYLMIADIPDRGRWYRVRLGGFETRADAAHYMKELQRRENVEALVVLNEQ